MIARLERELVRAQVALADAEEQGGRERIKAARRRVLTAAHALAVAKGRAPTKKGGAS